MPSKVSIQTVADRTGLTPHAIRAWERRYRAIEPSRSPGRHRMYSEEDIYRLSLLAHAARSGRLISRLCRLDNSQLLSLVQSDPRPPIVAASRGVLKSEGLDAVEREFLDRAFSSARKLDSQSLDEVLHQAQVTLGDQGVLRRVIAPMARLIGEEWRAGTLSMAQEHLFTASAKAFLWNFNRHYRFDHRTPSIVVGTPLGQVHDLGAAIVASTAASNGWKVCFVGASLPAPELVGAVVSSGSCALALSIVYPEDDSNLTAELKQLGNLLPHHIRLFVGGRAAHSYLKALNQAGARLLSSLEELDNELNSMRRVPHASQHKE